jgi:DNA gyrase subunit B
MTDPLDIIAAIRKRPGMYVGDVNNGSGLLHVLWEVVGNAVDEHLAGFCRSIRVTLEDEGRVTVEDDGRGISVAPMPDGVSLLETALTRVHDRATFDGHEKHVHLDGGGLGLAVVNAVSRETVVESAHGGRLHRQEFRAGSAVTPLVDLGDTARTGTRVTFAPDPEVFSRIDFDATRIRERLHDIAGFCPGLTLHFTDERRSVFSCPDGIADLLVRDRSGRPFTPDPPLRAVASEGRVRVEIVLQWTTHRRHGRVRSFVNLYETHEGGTHVAGMQRGLRGLVAGLPSAERASVAKALQERAVAIISVFHHDPTFDSPTRSRLASPEVRPVVEAAVRRCVNDFATARPDEVRRLLESMRAP